MGHAVRNKNKKKSLCPFIVFIVHILTHLGGHRDLHLLISFP